MAASLKIDVARRDPIEEFPPEVTSMIFALLNLTDLW
jgi:hypothetical protein